MRKASVLVSALLLVLLLVNCAPAATPVPATQQPVAPVAVPAPAKPAVAAATVRAAWELEWEKTLAAARNEGMLMLNTTAGSDLRRVIAEGFKKAYGLGMEVVVAPGGRAIPAIEAERRAGLYLRDAYVGGAGAMVLSLKPMAQPLDSAFILPDLTDPELIKKTWYESKLHWIDNDHTTLAVLLYPSPPLAINTNLVKKEEVRSWHDLLDPKWKGKLALYDPNIPGSGAILLVWIEKVLGWDWFRQLVKNEPVVMQDVRLMLEWLAHGKISVLVAPDPALPFTFRQAGAPVNVLTPIEGTWLGAGHGGVSILNRPAHPNATRVFINWLLSKEGQTILARSLSGQSTRQDVPTDFLDAEQVRVAGANYFNKEKEDLYLLREKMQAQANVILAPIMKK